MRKKSLFFLLPVFLFVSCSTTERTIQQHHIADSLSNSSSVQDRVGETSLNLDSIFSAWLQQTSLHQVSSDSSSEHITETITSYIDSLGRTVRQEQRTIDRSEARQLEQFYQQQLQQQQLEFSRQLARYDSLFQSWQNQQQVHAADELSLVQKPSSSLSWWQRLRLWFSSRLLYLIIIAVLYLLLRFAPQIKSFLRRYLHR